MVEETPEAGNEQPDKEDLLSLMRFWLFGTFMIVWAATFAYIAMFTNKDIMATLAAGWPIWVIVLVAEILLYAGYSLYMNRK